MSEITDSERIKKILIQYEKKRDREKERYNLIKDTEDFKLKNRKRAKDHYDKNKQIKKDKYANDKEFLSAKSQYHYYKKINKLDKFREKYPQKILLLNERNIMN
tara:strand:- start:1279 stop:1590 length:312 start_codon:yes stop_codon:yes gene_type:complete